MPAKLTIRSNEFPFHVTTRTNNKENFSIPLKEIWDISTHLLNEGITKYSVEIHQFVLMRNHYHLVVSTPKDPIDEFMWFFNKHLTQMILNASGRINRIFGGRYKGSLITNQNYLRNVYRYVYQNPIRAGLVDSCQKYEFSSLHANSKIQLTDPFQDPEEQKLLKNLGWLNKAMDNETENLVRRGLKKRVFTAGRNFKTRKPNILPL